MTEDNTATVTVTETEATTKTTETVSPSNNNNNNNNNNRMKPRKELQHMRSNSLPNVFHSSAFNTRLNNNTHKNGGRLSLTQQSQLATSDIFTDRMGMIDLNYHDTQKIVRDLLEHSAIQALPSLNERMSEEALEDSHAFADVNVDKPTTTRTSLSQSQLSSLEPLQESEDEDDVEDEEEDDEDEDETEEEKQQRLAKQQVLSPTSRLFPKKKKLDRNSPNFQLNKNAVSMPNIYGIRVSTGGSTSGSYNFLPDDGDLLTDHKGICDLEYSEMKKIVDNVLHHDGSAEFTTKDTPINSRKSATRTSINDITGGPDEAVIPEGEEEEEEEEELEAGGEEAAKSKEEATDTPSTTAATTIAEEEEGEEQQQQQQQQQQQESADKPKKKGFFQKLKARASKKKTLGNP